MTDILIYGLPPGEVDEWRETILFSKAATIEEAEKIKAILEEKHGCTRCRIWQYLGEAPDFARALRA